MIFWIQEGSWYPRRIKKWGGHSFTMIWTIQYRYFHFVRINSGAVNHDLKSNLRLYDEYILLAFAWRMELEDGQSRGIEEDCCQDRWTLIILIGLQ